MIDPVLQQAITEKGDELQVLTRLSAIYTAQEQILNVIQGIPDLSTLNKLIPLKQEEIGMYGLLTDPSQEGSSGAEPKEASRGDEIHTPILAFIGQTGAARAHAQTTAENFIKSLPTKKTVTGRDVCTELVVIVNSLTSIDQPPVNEIINILTIPVELTGFIEKTVYNQDSAKEEYAEKALSGLAEIVTLTLNPKKEVSDLSKDGFINDLLTNAHQCCDSYKKL